MTTGNRLFTEEQRQTLPAVLARIIPAEGESPSAGSLGFVPSIENAVSQNPRQRRTFMEGLAQLDIATARHGDALFLDLTDDAKDAALRDIESQFSAFFELLVRQCYNEYYTNSSVFESIGYSLPDSTTYEPRPFDESLLEPQRQRSPFWRQA